MASAPSIPRSANLGFGIADLRTEVEDQYDSKWWACKRCTKPDYVVKRWPNEPLRLTVVCKINPLAPFAASHNCPSFEQVLGIEELWD